MSETITMPLPESSCKSGRVESFLELLTLGGDAPSVLVNTIDRIAAGMRRYVHCGNEMPPKAVHAYRIGMAYPLVAACSVPRRVDSQLNYN